MAPAIYRAMDAPAITHDDAPVELFAARVTPNASLGTAGFVAVMVAMGAIGVVCGIMFARVGAWPVVPFLGLDVLLLYVAFRAYRKRSAAYEEIRITREEVLVRRVDWRGRRSEARFNPAWVRLEKTVLVAPEGLEGGLARLAIAWKGKLLQIATDLSAPEREAFAAAMDKALAAARRAGPSQVVAS